MNASSLAAQIAAAARFPIDAAEQLADYALSGNYRGGELHIGIGDFGYSATLYAVIYEVNGRWHIASIGRLSNGHFWMEEAATGQSAKSLRGCFHFEHNGHFICFTPDLTGLAVAA